MRAIVRMRLVPAKRTIFQLLVIAPGIGHLACGHESERAAVEYEVDDVEVVVSTESELIGRPSELLVGEEGNLFVLDDQMARVLEFSPSGDSRRTFGSEGGGPGEFRRPHTFALNRDTLRVVDMGNARLQSLSFDSQYLASTQLPHGVLASPGRTVLHGNASMLVATMGLDDALAIHYDEGGNIVSKIGVPVAPAEELLDLRAIKQEVLGGTVPAFFRNAVLPVFDIDGGGVWLIMNGERRLQYHGKDGALRSSAQLDAPEFDRIWQACIDRARETIDNPLYISVLSYVADAEVLGAKLWLLLNMPEDEPAVMLGVRADGAIDSKVYFSRVKGARRFSMDQARTRIYFTIPTLASLVSASVPAGVF